MSYFPPPALHPPQKQNKTKQTSKQPPSPALYPHNAKPKPTNKAVKPQAHQGSRAHIPHPAGLSSSSGGSNY
ncbi:uncharacterized protein K452DRAFT_288140, partial [Aplosporella prunicola CBS 121167]